MSKKIIIIIIITIVILFAVIGGYFVFQLFPIDEGIGEETGRETREQLNGEVEELEKSCLESGGMIVLAMCCQSTSDFPDICLIGPCGCSWDNSHEINICDCGEGKCFDGEKCVEASFNVGIASDSGPLNSIYIIEGQLVELKSGYSEKEAAPGSATKIQTGVWEEPVFGDLNADGIDDAALILIYNPGGSGTFYYVASSLRNEQEGDYSGTNAIFLGDRISVDSVSIREGIIEVDYKDRSENESMTTPPSIGITGNFKIEGITLEQVED
jgi:hypothetical protein